MLEQRALPYDTAYDALIMASIIEKETGLAIERTRCRLPGSLFVALQRRMRLQTDPNSDLRHGR